MLVVAVCACMGKWVGGLGGCAPSSTGPYCNESVLSSISPDATTSRTIKLDKVILPVQPHKP